MINVGDRISGNQFYGKRNKLVGIVANIEPVVYLPQPGYSGMDIVTVAWDDGQVARFHRETIRYPLITE